MKEYKIPIFWESYKIIPVEAENLQSAVHQALKQFLAEPDDNYLQDSFEIDGIIEDDYPDEEFDINIIIQNL